MILVPNYRIFSTLLVLGLAGSLRRDIHSLRGPILTAPLLSDSAPKPVITTVSPKTPKKAAARPIRSAVAEPIRAAGNPSVTYDLVTGDTKQEYQLIFSGQMDCAKSLCQDIPLQLSLSTAHNPDIMSSAQTDSEGRYMFKTTLLEEPDRAVDWSLRVASGYGEGQAAGRRILNVDTSVIIEPRLIVIR